VVPCPATATHLVCTGEGPPATHRSCAHLLKGATAIVCGASAPPPTGYTAGARSASSDETAFARVRKVWVGGEEKSAVDSDSPPPMLVSASATFSGSGDSLGRSRY